MEQTIDPKDAALEYEQLKIKSREIEERLKILQPIVLSIVPEGKNVMASEGYFYTQVRNKWKFSQTVEKAEEDVEKLKDQEKADGTAEAIPSLTLYYKTGEPKEFSQGE